MVLCLAIEMPSQCGGTFFAKTAANVNFRLRIFGSMNTCSVSPNSTRLPLRNFCHFAVAMKRASRTTVTLISPG